MIYGVLMLFGMNMVTYGDDVYTALVAVFVSAHSYISATQPIQLVFPAKRSEAGSYHLRPLRP